MIVSMPGAPHAPARGFSLVELMVALTVSLMVIGSMLAVIITSSGTGKSRERAGDVHNTGRFALEMIKRDLQHAGFLGNTSVIQPELDKPVPFTVTDVCDSSRIGQLSRRIEVENNDNPYKNRCVRQGDYEKDTDVILVRHLSPVPVPVASMQANLIYVRSAYQGFEAFLGGTPPDLSRYPTPANDYQLAETVYYINRFTNDKNEKPQIPALYRARLGSGPAMVTELVATGVENMQVRLKERLTDTTEAWVEPNDVVDWSRVVAAEISLLVRSPTLEPNLKNERQFTLGNEVVKVPNDAIPREVFTTVVYLRN